MSANPLTLPNVQFEVSDRGHEYLQKLRDLAAAVDACITEYNNSIGAGTEAQTVLDQINQVVGQITSEAEGIRDETQLIKNATETIKQQTEQIRDQTSAISESGLPIQTGNASKTLTSNGTSTSWQFAGGFNRLITANAQLNAGDRAAIHATQELELTLPVSIVEGTPIFIRNTSNSTEDVILHINTSIKTLPNQTDWQSGDTVRIKPGESLFLSMNNATLEAIL